MSSTVNDLSHPSYLELDRLALGAPRAPATAAHVAACDRCRAHVEGLGQVEPLPAGLRDRALRPAPAIAIDRLFAGRRRWLWGGGALAGAAAAALLVLARPAPVRNDAAEGAGYVGTKGLPSVWIYVKHESDLSLWDGERPLAPGDRLRLKIDPQGHTHADVFTEEEGGDALVRVWSGSVDPDEVTTLPAAWQLDASPRRAYLVVVLGRQGCTPAQARRFVEQGAPAGVWLRRFELRKPGRATESP